MPFLESSPPDFTETLPFPLSTSLEGSFGASSDWDVTIGPLGFGLRLGDGQPYVRSTEAARKQQFDTSREPGEQSLSSWWVRSQSSWDLGAGIRYYEPGTEEGTINRFADCRGVNVWSPGEISLLHQMAERVTPTTGTARVGAGRINDTPGFVYAADDEVRWVTEGGVASATLSNGDATKPAIVGGAAHFGRRGGVDGWDGVGATWPVVVASDSDEVCQVWYAKARLIVSETNKLYWLPTTGGTLPGDGVLLFEHPDPGWRWVGVTETGGALLAAGCSGSTSEIYRVALQDDEGIPSLMEGSAAVTATMPHGEVIAAIGVYLGSVLVLCTNLGVRIGQASDEGMVRYGPLSVDLEHVPTDVAFWGTYAWVSTERDGIPAAVRVDLAAPINDSGRFAWAWDVEVPDASGLATSVAVIEGKVVLAAASGAWEESDLFVAEGRLDTGRIRFGTVESKAFRYMRLDGNTFGGSIGADIVDAAGNTHYGVRMNDAFNTNQDIPIQIPGPALHGHLGFDLVLSPSDDETTTPVVTGFSIKAVPAPRRVRLFRFPLSVFDFEFDRYGNANGYEGAAFDRLSDLESLEETSTPVRVVDNRTGEGFIGQVDLVEFQATSSPDKSEHGFGGVATVTIRRL